MARLQVEVRPGTGVGGYSLFVDGVPAAMGAGHRGEASCAGRCGDGSPHAVLYSFNGTPGATLGIALRCGGRLVCRIAGARIAEGAHRAAGRKIFEI
ncbi:MAG TPA: hypothetical protein VFZ91_06355 [Allosphingosinicella sp.]